MFTSYSVHELTKRIKLAIENDPNLQAVTVRGEIYNYRKHSSGHVWFSLKDDFATIRCVMFKSRAVRLEFTPSDGLSVLAFGSVSVYEKEGQYQLYVETMVPEGQGALKLEFERLKSKLASEGLFDPGRKRPIPFFPRKIGVVTSIDGAALRDIIAVARRRCPCCELVVSSVLVQGDNAPAEICEGLALVNEVDGVDVIILGRGGGSAEELCAFNDERVARAVYASKAPVIAAVGHERDVTLVDLVADLRAPTPSAAAELAVPDKVGLSIRIKGDVAGLKKAASLFLEKRRAEVQLLARVLASRGPEFVIANRAQQVEDYRNRIQIIAEKVLSNYRHRVELAEKTLRNCDPDLPLKRGYAVVRTSGGELVTSCRQVSPGQAVDVRLHEGGFEALVKAATEVNPA
ncbi:MAG TPA: exodeoxyribonuclease VII large subunit [Firmicutes bacterium]|nr:exodeoxyribonuclease VII large subunit [Bacillota bacterium]